MPTTPDFHLFEKNQSALIFMQLNLTWKISIAFESIYYQIYKAGAISIFNTLKIQYTNKMLNFGVLGFLILKFWECWGFGFEKTLFKLIKN